MIFIIMRRYNIWEIKSYVLEWPFQVHQESRLEKWQWLERQRLARSFWRLERKGRCRDRYISPNDRMKPTELVMNPRNFQIEDMLIRILNKVETLDKVLKEMKLDFSQLSQTVMSHSASIKHLETQLGDILACLNQWPKGGSPSDTMANPKNVNQQRMTITIHSGKIVNGATPPLKVNVGEVVKVSLFESAKDLKVKDSCVVVNEEGNTFGNPGGDGLEEVRGDSSKAKGTPSKNYNSASNLKALYVKIDPSLPQRLKKKGDHTKFQKFLSIFNSLSINIPLVETLVEMPGYAKYLKELMTKKRTLQCETIEVSHYYRVIMTKHLVAKKDDPGAFTIPCTIRACKVGNALCNLGA